MKQHSTNTEFDIIIIGGGISGLTSAGLFSRFGYRVCVLEMDARPGGYIAGFNRLNYRFDSAIHWLNQCDEKGLVTHAFKLIGNDFPKAKTQHSIKKFTIGGESYRLTTDVDQFMHQLIKNYPQDEMGIRRFFKDAKRISRSFENFRFINRNMSTMNLWSKMKRGLQMTRFVLPFIPHVRYSGTEGKLRGLRKYFTHQDLINHFSAEPDLLSCLIPISWAYSQDYQTPPKGGSQMYAEWLHHVIESLGGEVRFHSKVEEILVTNGRATAVRYQTKGLNFEVKSKYIIAACDVSTLYNKLLPKDYIDAKLMQRLSTAELYPSAFTVSLALDCPTKELGFGEEILHIFDKKLPREHLTSGDPATTAIQVIAGSERDSTLAPHGCGTLTIFIPSYFELNNNWGITQNDDGTFSRNETYKTLKQQHAQILIERIEKELQINLQSHIVYTDIATPITHQRYTGNYRGTMMGARPGKVNMQAKIAHYHTLVPNVFLSGHWAELGGGIPIAVRAAMNSTLLVFEKENKQVFNLLADYMDGKISINTFNSQFSFQPYANDFKPKPTPAEKFELKRKASID